MRSGAPTSNASTRSARIRISSVSPSAIAIGIDTAPLERAYAQLRAELGRIRPDVIVAFINDHFRSFSLAMFPAFCIGLGDVHVVPMRGWCEILLLRRARFAGD